jgi:uncharacterized protein YggE
MHPRIRSLALVAVLGAAFGAGCTHNGGAHGPIVVSNESTGIVVQGRGEMDVQPDVAVVQLGVEATAPSVADAREQAAEAANRLMSALQNDGVAREDIQTRGLSIQPHYVYPPMGGEPKIDGYTVSNHVSAKIRRIDGASRVIDDAVEAGGDAVRLHGIQFEVDDPSDVRTAAREKAIAEARAKAEQMAALSGVKLGAPLAIEEISFSNPGWPVPMMEGLNKDASSTPVSPGLTKVAVEIRVRWAING